MIPNELSKEIETYENNCKQYINDFLEELEKKPKPSILYHYTNSIGLHGILNSGKVHFTDLFNQNDPSELRHGVELASDILENNLSSKHIEVKDFTDKFKSFCKDGGIETSAYYFISCFSVNGDDLGQWRAYGDNGKGFAIGFDSHLLVNAFNEPNNPNISGDYPITYSDGEMSILLQKIVDDLVQLILLPENLELSTDIILEYKIEIAIAFSINVLNVVCLFKHMAYKNEEEYRFFHVHRIDEPIDDLCHQARSNTILKFLEFDWKTNHPHSLSKVIIGPSAKDDSACSFVEECLQYSGLGNQNVEISKSKIPYRS